MNLVREAESAYLGKTFQEEKSEDQRWSDVSRTISDVEIIAYFYHSYHERDVSVNDCRW